MAQPREFGGGRTVRLHWFHVGIHVLHGRAYFPPAITPAVGRPARCTVTLPGDTGSVGDVAPHRQQASSRISRVATSPTRVLQAQITQRCTRYVAKHPLRGAAPVTSHCTRTEEVQCLRIGCTASHNKPNRGQFVPTDPNRQHRTQPHILETRGNAVQRRLKRRFTTEKHTPATRPLTAALISCLNTLTPESLEESDKTVELTGTFSDCAGTGTPPNTKEPSFNRTCPAPCAITAGAKNKYNRQTTAKATENSIDISLNDISDLSPL